MPPLIVADIALGALELGAELDLGEPGACAHLLEQFAERFPFAAVERLLHAHTLKSGLQISKIGILFMILLELMRSAPRATGNDASA